MASRQRLRTPSRSIVDARPWTCVSEVAWAADEALKSPRKQSFPKRVLAETQPPGGIHEAERCEVHSERVAITQTVAITKPLAVAF